MSPTSGTLITFEGGEGVGKSTQVQRLKSRFEALGASVIVTREPGGSPHAEALRDVLLSGYAKPLGPTGEALLFTAARIDHVDAVIAPALRTGKVVICDRFIDSTLAYQGALGRVNGGLIAALEHVAIGTRRPDFTILIDLPADVGLARAAMRRGSERPDRFEQQADRFHAALRDAFLSIAAAEPDRVMVVDGSQTPLAISDAIWSEAARRFPHFADRAA